MKLLVLQSMWAMENILPDGTTLPMPEAIQRIADHGFDGITDHMIERRKVQAIMSELKPLGLTMEGQCFPTSIDALKPTIELAAEFGCHHVTIQPDVRTRNLREAMRIIEGWQKLAEQIDVPVLIETHRYRLTNDLLFTLEILDAMPNLQLLGDLSHYVAGHEIPLDEGAAVEIAQLQRIMRNCQAYHGRIADREHVQIPISFAQHQPWVEAFQSLWHYGFTDWKHRHQQGDTLSFTCELGTRPYAITGHNGLDITDRWQESLQLKALAEKIWANV
ncbi:sugar phosphate isomerase/epimerase family protein [Parathalassolituus penaei]|uniref:TIM barrel protein n=1 Tax=Parathalassolituus penaei TaxID=2997323 RepID=A0A9X3EBN6_9GAMM|nr:TIM barrel protein [Parathalassolituus penaei]MCY0964608.1 TIM barrel protein [Parathalassolituus penaei]